LALAIVVVVLGGITLLVTAFGNDRGGGEHLTLPQSVPVTSTPPAPQVLATIGNLRVQSPVAQDGLAAVGFLDSADGALVLKPVGPQANEGLLARLWHKITGASRNGQPWYQLEEGATRTLEVGTAPGTDVYSPVDGTVVAIRPHIVSGRRIGAEIELQPSAAPSLVVEIEHVRADPALTVGANVAAGSSKLGTAVDITRVEHQSLGRYAGDAGNNVSIEVFLSATIDVP
jgi:hypothetical protein